MKKLILVGNKQIDVDISKEVEQFDVVVRLNRMNNWENTGKRTDILLVDPHPVFFKMIDGQDCLKYQTARKLLFNKVYNKPKVIVKLLKQNVFTLDQLQNKDVFDIYKYKHTILKPEDGNVDFSNFFALLNYVIQKYSSNYEIWITGIDVYERSSFFATNESYKNSRHLTAGIVEETRMKNMIEHNVIKYMQI